MSAVALRDFQPDPKAPPRIRDTAAIRRKVLTDDECRGCGEQASEGHHIIFRSNGGDDVEENIAPLCGGDGSCHVRFHRDTSDEGRQLRAEIGRRLRPEEVAYVLGKLGRGPGLDYLRRTYGFSLRPKRKRRRTPVDEVVVSLDAARARAQRRAAARSRSQAKGRRRRAHGRRS